MPDAVIEEMRQLHTRFIPHESMQIQLGLDAPVASPQSPQGLMRYARTRERPFISGRNLQRNEVGKGVAALRGLFARSLAGYGQRMGLGGRTYPAGVRQRRYAANRIAKQGNVVIPS
jgi:hypothetical protein